MNVFMNKFIYTCTCNTLLYKKCIYKKLHTYKHTYACVYISMCI